MLRKSPLQPRPDRSLLYVSTCVNYICGGSKKLLAKARKLCRQCQVKQPIMGQQQLHNLPLQCQFVLFKSCIWLGSGIFFPVAKCISMQFLQVAPARREDAPRTSFEASTFEHIRT